MAYAEAAQLFLRSIRQTRNATHGCERHGIQAKALQRSLPGEALRIDVRGLAPAPVALERAMSHDVCFELRQP